MICYECSQKLAKPRDKGVHTALKCRCDYCKKEHVCLPDRHYIFNSKVKSDEKNN